MGNAGFSKARLERMHRVLSGYIERKELPAMAALVSHHDEANVETLGEMSFRHPALMARDAIFRTASLTKPVAPVLTPEHRSGAEVFFDAQSSGVSEWE